MGDNAHRDLIAKAVRIAFPDSIKEHSGEPFKRPAWTEDGRSYTSGFYYENLDADRFYFDTFDEAAEDFAVEIGMDEAEADQVVTAGKAVA